MTDSPHVLITGCSSGIGLATAHHMKQRGWTVWPTARKDADLQALQDAGFQPIPLDVSDSDSIQTAVETLRTHTGCNLRGLVNNADSPELWRISTATRCGGNLK